LHLFIYVTEVPKGYQRITFRQLKPDANWPALPPPAALDLDGKRVFIKGYIYPDGQSSNTKRFVLIPERTVGHFGRQLAPTDMILVSLRDPNRVARSHGRLKLGGMFHVNLRLKPISGIDAVYYQLDADYVR
jgi:hypothetical protein